MYKSPVTILKEGGIGVFPTDTLYGLVGSARIGRTVERIYELKGRDENKPFIILISSYVELKKFAVNLTDEQKAYLESVWPGEVSVILPVPRDRFAYLHRGTNSLAFRMPKMKTIASLLKKTGPLVAPSANPQGEKPAESIKEAKAYFGTKVDFYESVGVRKGKPSKLVSMVSGTPVVLRD